MSLHPFFDFLKDPNDQLSSKRLLLLGSSLSAVAYIWVFAAWGKLDPATGLTAFVTMIGIGAAGATLDHFTGNRDGSDHSEDRH